MAMQTMHRYTLRAEIKGEIPYDATKPESYADALAKVAEKRAALQQAGATILVDKGQPVVVRE